MDKYRNRGVREVIPLDDEPLENHEPQSPNPHWEAEEPQTNWGEMARSLADTEPYDPAKHAPPQRPELYSQNTIDALGRAKFEPYEPGVWHRPILDAAGEHTGQHFLIHEPGNRLKDGSRAPWTLMNDPEDIGTAHPSVHHAIRAADTEAAAISKKAGVLFHLVAGQSAGRQDADRWLSENSGDDDERAQQEARRWMEENSHLYDEWHPEQESATPGMDYPDFRDPAGMSFSDEGERAHVMPGSHYNWENPESEWHHPDMFDEPGEEENRDQDILHEHGFDWRAVDPTAGTPENPYTPGTPGEYYRHQHTPEGDHVATHVIRQNPGDRRWSLESEPADTPGFSDHSSVHGFLPDAIDQYRQNAAEALLPKRGYEPERGRTGWARNWTRTDPGGYEHEIHFPEEGGFAGSTINQDRFPAGSFAPHGTVRHNSDDLADVVREQDRTGQGMHPGGDQDFRLSKAELLNDPSVAGLGQPSTISDNFWGDNKVGRASWHLPHPTDPIHAEAVYNWDKGGYDFKYTHDGIQLYPHQTLFPAGAPTHVPGRQYRLPIETRETFNINDYRRPRE